MFDLRQRLVNDFSEYIRSFIKIRDESIEQFVESELDRGALWPEPLMGLNPSFESGGSIDELCEEGLLDSRCGTIFRSGKGPDDHSGQLMRLHCHQVEAIRSAKAQRNYVLTTGTGSGKSLAYIVPIVDSILSNPQRGIRAIVVYPMNALANSQVNELDKFLGFGPSAGIVTYRRYTGQENDEERDKIVASPPHILLTNFMMLELILTRPYERDLVKAMSNLQFVVLDELHTYRGRQGSDVALLMRRLREATRSKTIQCVGTSATLATEGKAADRRAEVARVGSQLFGSPVMSEDVIGETLRPFSDVVALDPEILALSLRGARLDSRRDFQSHPLTAWLERVVALEPDDEGKLRRRPPEPLFGLESTSQRLSDYAKVSIEEAENAIEEHLQAASKIEPNPLVFRLHQFISPGDGIFSTLDVGPERYLTLEGQKASPNDPNRLLFPLAFCRTCGQHYFIVNRQTSQEGIGTLLPRRLSDTYRDDKNDPGFLFLPDDPDAVDLDALIPDDWLEETNSGTRIRRSKAGNLPKQVSVSPDGALGTGAPGWFLGQPFPLCMNPECGQSYGAREADFTKLSVLGMQGRSTATTTLALSTLGYLREQHAPDQKLLSFTDNRQDASLQSGHLNDFVDVTMLRAAIRAAAERAGEEGMTHDRIALAVEAELGLEQEDFAAQPSNLPTQVTQRRAALRDVLGYRVYRDLRRGWRVNAPNLEQVGLLRIEYPDLAFVCEDGTRWSNAHQALVAARPNVRKGICLDLLERVRKKLAVRVDYLNADFQDGMKRRSSQFLKSPWALSEEEVQLIDSANYVWLDSSASFEDRNDLALTPKSAFGNYLRRPTTFGGSVGKLTLKDTQKLIEDLVDVLTEAALLIKVHPRPNVDAYQLNAEAFVWCATEPGPEHKRTHNRFFELLYREGAKKLRGIHSREHTAQVTAEEREVREQDFRSGKLPILFCSPTMELGVDIRDLSVVNMRNIPPTPANYAQRSGRAGRSGQPALVFSYCTAGSPHDQYYFRRPSHMVAGAVAPPRLDLTNEDLVRAHVHAIWLEEANLDLGKSLSDKVLDVGGQTPTLELQQEIRDALNNPSTRKAALGRAQQLVDTLGVSKETTPWLTHRWVSDVVDQIPLAFDRACDRWRNLYKSAMDQQARQNKVILDMSAPHHARERAQHLRREAEDQMKLLTESGSEMRSDFYAYRYLASEGFLPGYNFPRLPLTAYLPAIRGQRDEYLSRPRFLAISEFGPQAVVYHEGSRYLVDRVMMPPSMRQETGQLAAGTAKLCSKCGYLHGGDSAATADVCDRCGTGFNVESLIPSMFRLEGVFLRRRDRITCDEEERMRQGFEIRTGVRFEGLPGEEHVQRADIEDGAGTVLASLTYAPTATIWRINVGWNRRQDASDLGYLLDLDRSKWISDKRANALAQDDQAEAAQRVARIVPYVQDRRNVLIFDWKAAELNASQYASLQAALKSAIQAVFQLEDSELAAEPLPNSDERRSILFYESAEGGAGVLRRLAEDEGAVRTIALKALELCHFDPETLRDRRKSPRAKDDCSSACYDCLLSYGNQRDHIQLDRFLVRDLLDPLRLATLRASSDIQSRSDKLRSLLDRCGSGLEKQWLELLEDLGLALPTHAQFRIKDCNTVPDFVYVHGGMKLAVYIDGPPHDYPNRQLRDADQDGNLLLKGWLVQRFHHQDDWRTLLTEYPGVYGDLR